MVYIYICVCIHIIHILIYTFIYNIYIYIYIYIGRESMYAIQACRVDIYVTHVYILTEEFYFELWKK